MYRLLFCCCLLFSLQVNAQGYIGKSKKKVEKALARYEAGTDFEQPVITLTDTSIVMVVKTKAGASTRFNYFFDAKGTCRAEQVIASCDSCYRKYLDAVLAQTAKYHWQKINENQYISSYREKRVLELPAEPTDYSYVILRTNWTKALYAMLPRPE